MIGAQTPSTSVANLLDSPRIGVIHLDRQGRIVETNDRARAILRRGDGVSDRDGELRTYEPAAHARLERLIAGALPTSGAVAVSESMLIHRSSMAPPFVVHVKPVDAPQMDFGAQRVAVLVLIAEPGYQARIDPSLVAETLGLTLKESQVAVWLVEGRTVREIAVETGAAGKLHPLALKADLPQARPLPADGLGTAGAVDRRVRVSSVVPAAPPIELYAVSPQFEVRKESRDGV